MSTSLDEGDLEHMITATVNVSWERPLDHEDMDVFEAWVGSGSLGEFEEPTLLQRGTVVTFEVRVLKHRWCGLMGVGSP